MIEAVNWIDHRSFSIYSPSTFVSKRESILPRGEEAELALIISLSPSFILQWILLGPLSCPGYYQFV